MKSKGDTMHKTQVGTRNSLTAKWFSLMERLEADPMEAARKLEELLKRYNTGRHYHNEEHIAKMLAEFENLRPLAKNPEAVEFAIWFHDAIYDSRRKDNELESAILARSAAWDLGLDQNFALLVFRLVMATEHKRMPEEDDEKIVVDLDLATLGSSPEVFMANTATISSEYSWLEEREWEAGRKQFMEAMLRRPHIFSTEAMREKYEAQARKNLKETIQRMR